MEVYPQTFSIQYLCLPAMPLIGQGIESQRDISNTLRINPVLWRPGALRPLFNNLVQTFLGEYLTNI